MMKLYRCLCLFFFQAEDGIRDLVRSRGLGDVYKRQAKRDLKPLAVGASANLEVGQKVFAIGNPFGLDHTLTTGLSLIHI